MANANTKASPTRTARPATTIQARKGTAMSPRTAPTTIVQSKEQSTATSDLAVSSIAPEVAQRSAIPKVQPKVTIGAPNDHFEQEADHVADQVVSMPPPKTATSITPIDGGGAGIQKSVVQQSSIAKSITPIAQRAEAPKEEVQEQAEEEHQVQSKVVQLAVEMQEPQPIIDESRGYNLQAKPDDNGSGGGKVIQLQPLFIAPKEEFSDASGFRNTDEFSVPNGNKGSPAGEFSTTAQASPAFAQHNTVTVAPTGVQRMEMKDLAANFGGLGGAMSNIGLQTKLESSVLQAKCAACEAKESETSESSSQGGCTSCGGGSDVQTKRLTRGPPTIQTFLIQTACKTCEGDQSVQSKVQRSGDESSTASSSFESNLSSSKGGGQPMSENVQSDMEGRFGADFSDVRVHTDSNAVQMSQDIGAQAFTHGSDVYFNEGKYEPDSSSGKHLLAHELTHTVQQGGASAKSDSVQSSPDPNALLQKKPEGIVQKASDLSEEELEDLERQLSESTDERVQAIDPAPAENAKQEAAKPNPDEVEIPVEEKLTDDQKVDKDQKEKKDKIEPEGGKQDSDAPKEKADTKLGTIGKELENTSKDVCGNADKKATQMAENEKTHDTAEDKQKNTDNAVVPPAEEGQQLSNGEQVEKLDKQPEPQPNEARIKQDMDQAISAGMPRDVDDMNKFKSRGEGAVMGAAVMKSMNKDIDAVKSTYNEVNTVPSPKVPDKQPVELPAIEVAPSTPELNLGKDAVPPVQNNQVDMEHHSKASDDLLEKEGISEENLAMVDKGDLAEAGKERKSLKKKVIDNPKQIQDDAKKKKEKVETDMKSEEKKDREAIEKKRKAELEGSKKDQEKTKSDLELKREKVTADIKKIYDDTKKKVDERLKRLDTENKDEFDHEQKKLSYRFEKNVNRRVEAWKDDRYSGLFGGLKWLKDKLFGIEDFPAITRIFRTERKAFVDGMNAVVARITKKNGEVITECKKWVSDAEKKIKKYVADLGPELKDVGNKAMGDMQKKLDDLDKAVDAKKDELTKKLCDKKKAAIKDIDKKIEAMKEEMSGLVSKLGNLLLDAMIKFFKWALEKMGLGGGKLFEILDKGKKIIKKIVGDPIGFIKNLFNAVKKGVELFGTNIKQHLINGMVNWLTGSAGNVNVELPEKWDVKGVATFGMSLLGITWENFRVQLVKRLGEPAVKVMETSMEVVQVIRKDGAKGMWQWMKDKAEEIKSTMMDTIRNWLIENLVKAAMKKLITMMAGPWGAIIEAIKTIWNLIMFLVDNFDRIVAMVGAVFDTIGPIAMGNIGEAAKKVETAMGMTIPMILDFLAKLIGLGKITDAMNRVIEKIQKPIKNIMKKAIDFIAKKGKKLLGKTKKGVSALGKKGKKLVSKLFSWAKKKIVGKLKGRKMKGNDLKKLLNDTKKAKKFKSIKLVKAGKKGKYNIVAEINPKEVLTDVYLFIPTKKVPSKNRNMERKKVPETGEVQNKADAEMNYRPNPKSGTSAESALGLSSGLFQRVTGKHAEGRIRNTQKKTGKKRPENWGKFNFAENKISGGKTGFYNQCGVAEDFVAAFAGAGGNSDNAERIIQLFEISKGVTGKKKKAFNRANRGAYKPLNGLKNSLNKEISKISGWQQTYDPGHMIANKLYGVEADRNLVLQQKDANEKNMTLMENWIGDNFKKMDDSVGSVEVELLMNVTANYSRSIPIPNLLAYLTSNGAARSHPTVKSLSPDNLTVKVLLNVKSETAHDFGDVSKNNDRVPPGMQISNNQHVSNAITEITNPYAPNVFVSPEQTALEDAEGSVVNSDGTGAERSSSTRPLTPAEKQKLVKKGHDAGKTQKKAYQFTIPNYHGIASVNIPTIPSVSEELVNQIAASVAPPSRDEVDQKSEISPATRSAREQQADNVADQVTSGNGGNHIARSITPLSSQAGGVATKPLQLLRERSMPQPELDSARSSAPVQAKFIQRDDDGSGGGTASAGFESSLNSSKGGGSSMDDNTRGEMESGFGADFSGVRIHTDSQAASMNSEIGARAFTHGNDIYFNEGQYDPGSSGGKHLLAHELTHTVQQGAAPVQRKEEQPISRGPPQTVQRGLFGAIGDAVGGAVSAVGNAASSAVSAVGDAASAVGSAIGDAAGAVMDTVMGWIRPHVNNIPGYSMLSVVLGKDLLTQEDVPRTPENLIRGFLGMYPGGELLFQKMNEHGAITEASEWITTKVDQLGLTWSNISGMMSTAWDRMGITLGVSGNLQVISDVFGPTFQRIVDFAVEVGVKILEFIKNAILIPMAEIAHGRPGFTLLTVIIGSDPVTGQAVERNAMNLIGGFMQLIGEEEKWQMIQDSNMISKAWIWFEEKIAEYDFSLERITNMFTQAWETLSIDDLLTPLAALEKIWNIFGGFIIDVFTFAGEAAIKVLEFIFEGFMILAGPFGQRIMATLQRTRRVFDIIWNDPMAFAMNIINAVKKGMDQFVQNILIHLRDSLIEWLFGSVEGGIRMPENFDFAGILDLGLQILGLSYQNLRLKLVNELGEEQVARLETIFEFVRIIVTEGLQAAWEKILEFGVDIISGIIEGVTQMVIQSIVEIGMQKMAMMLAGPYGAILEAILTTYRFIKTLIERIEQIMSFVNGVLDAIEPIAMGEIDAAANFVERSLQRGLTMLISFLAGLIGLGDIPSKIADVIGTVRGAVDRALDAVVGWVVSQARSLLGAAPENEDAENDADLDVRANFEDNGGEGHELFFREEGSGFEVQMASDNPRAVLTRINEKLAEDETTDVEAAACNQAKTLLAQLDSFTTANKEILEDLGHDQHASKKAEVGTKLEAIKLKVVEGGVDVEGVVPDTQVSYGGGSGGFAGSMIADPLTELGPDGSEPQSSATNSHWEALRQRYQGGRTWYARGHLLNHNIHGPGTLQNLAPITQNSNGRHRSRVETPIKLAVAAGKVVKYEVNANGSPGVRSDLITGINESEDAPDVKATKRAIVEAETHVPLEFACRWSIYASAADYEANNPEETDSASIDTYESGRTPNAAAITLRGGAAPTPPPPSEVNINSATKEQLMLLPGVGAATADAIIAGRPFTSASQMATALHEANSSINLSESNLTSGDIAVQFKLQRSGITIGAANDHYEREADSVADRVVSQQGPPTSITPLGSGGTQRKLQLLRERSMPQPELDSGRSAAVQAKFIQREGGDDSGGAASSNFESSLNASKGGGSTMDENTQAEMETGIGADFSGVRVHTGADAVQMSSDVGARAFTHGNNIYFNQGQYNPESQDGKHLLAHELTHTVQQGASKTTDNVQAKHIEQQADRGPPISTNAGPGIQRGLWSSFKRGVRRVGRAIKNVAGNVKKKIKKWVKDRVHNIPGYTMLTVIIGKDPVVGESVPRSPANFLRGFMGMAGPIGEQLYQKMNSTGAITAASKWITGAVNGLRITRSSMVATWKRAWNEMSVSKGVGGNVAVFKKHFGPIARRIVNFVKTVSSKILQLIKDAIIKPLAVKLSGTRGYPLFTTIIGQDPLTGKKIKTSLLNILKGFLFLDPKGEHYWNQLQKSGKIDQVSTWLQKNLKKFKLSPKAIVKGFKDLWKSLKIGDILTPIKTFKKVWTTFTTPVKNILGFIWEVVKFVFGLIKEYFLGLLKEKADGIPGYPLLTVILKKDPLTDKKVPRTAKNFIKGFMSLVPGGLKKYRNLEKSGAIDKAFKWLSLEIKKLNLSWSLIKTMFTKAWGLLKIENLLKPIPTIKKFIGIFAEPVKRIVTFAVNVALKILEFIFIGVLGDRGAKVLGLLKKTKSTFKKIVQDPIGFLKNLLGALKKGFKQFSGNIFDHLKKGLVGWLFGALEGAGLQLPEKFDFKGIMSLVMQVMGLTWPNLRPKFVKHLGEKVVGAAETAFDWIMLIKEKGFSGIWERILEKIQSWIGGLKEKVFGGIRDWVMTKIVETAITKLVTMFNPVGAVIQSILTIYDTVTFFVDKFDQIFVLVETIVNSISKIASGNIADAANWVEKAMARTIPVVIGFLAKLINLDGISDTIKGLIEKVQDWVGGKVDKLIEWIVGKVKKLYKAGKDKVAGWFGFKKQYKDPGGNSHSLYFEGSGPDMKLMRASAPLLFKDYMPKLRTYITAEPAREAKHKSDLEKAEGLQGDIASVQWKETETGSGKYQPNHPSKNAGEALQKDINSLVEILGRLPSPDGTIVVRPKSKIDWDGTKSTTPTTKMVSAGHTGKNEDGTGVTADPLTMEASEAGSGATYSSNIWSHFTSSRKESVIRGHVLHHGLHGTGAEAKNIAPISSSDNGLMKTRFETKAFHAVFQENKVLSYKIGFDYGGHGKGDERDLIPSKINVNVYEKKYNGAENAAERKDPAKYDGVAESIYKDSWNLTLPTGKSGAKTPAEIKTHIRAQMDPSLKADPKMAWSTFYSKPGISAGYQSLPPNDKQRLETEYRLKVAKIVADQQKELKAGLATKAFRDGYSTWISGKVLTNAEALVPIKQVLGNAGGSVSESTVAKWRSEGITAGFEKTFKWIFTTLTLDHIFDELVKYLQANGEVKKKVALDHLRSVFPTQQMTKSKYNTVLKRGNKFNSGMTVSLK